MINHPPPSSDCHRSLFISAAAILLALINLVLQITLQHHVLIPTPPSNHNDEPTAHSVVEQRLSNFATKEEEAEADLGVKARMDKLQRPGLVDEDRPEPLPQPPSSHANKRHSNNNHPLIKDDDEEPWQMVLPNASSHPYSKFTPHIDLIWARGWYNIELPPSSIPMSYYNSQGFEGGLTGLNTLKTYLDPKAICQKGRHRFVWIRTIDIMKYPLKGFPDWCNISLITSDSIQEVPGGSASSSTHYSAVVHTNLNRPFVHQWYSQNVNTAHPKLVPIPLGLPLHYGFDGSPDTLHTVQALADLRLRTPAFEQRNRSILVDVGTFQGKGDRRYFARNELSNTITTHCPNTVTRMPRSPTYTTWTRYYSQHQLAVAPTGTGRDTYRIWELLLLGTVPIVQSDDIDNLVLPAHVPVLLIDDWQEVCDLAHNTTLYDRVVQRYREWIAHAHHWLRPRLWIPRNQRRMEELCQQFPGCLEARRLSHRTEERNVEQALQAARHKLRLVQLGVKKPILRQRGAVKTRAN